MDSLFNMLASSARFNNSKNIRKHKISPNSIDDSNSINNEFYNKSFLFKLRSNAVISTKKKKHSQTKLDLIHRESINYFRNCLGIRLSKENKYDLDISDPISCFTKINPPNWWKDSPYSKFESLKRRIVNNIERGKWITPTPIQMQCIPVLMVGRDLMGCSPTGSGKSGAFIIPLLFFCSYNNHTFDVLNKTNVDNSSSQHKEKKQFKKDQPVSKKGNIRGLILAPSLELASQLYREVERIGYDSYGGGLKCSLLTKANASTIGRYGNKGLDVLIATPMRLLDCLEGTNHNSGKGLDFSGLKMVVLDEADRLLETSDGNKHLGLNRSKSFLSQIDSILSFVPDTATRALFSATLGQSVRDFSESILRNPVDVTIVRSFKSNKRTSCNNVITGISDDVTQKFQFVGREEGKILSIRQMIHSGIKPPVMLFLQSKERAQALYEELLHENVHVDVLHAGRSKTLRESAVSNFRSGKTWMLICTDVIARGMDFKAVNTVINYDLPTNAVTYVHRNGRTGRAGRKGEAITLFTEADFGVNLRSIANVAKLSGCEDVKDWMLVLRTNEIQHKRGISSIYKQRKLSKNIVMKRKSVSTTPGYDKRKKNKKKACIAQTQNMVTKSEIIKNK